MVKWRDRIPSFASATLVPSADTVTHALRGGRVMTAREIAEVIDRPEWAVCEALLFTRDKQWAEVAPRRRHGPARWVLTDHHQSFKDKMLATIRNKGGSALRHLSDNAKNDKDVVLCAVQHAGCAMRYASRALRSDRAFTLSAVRRKRDVIKYVLGNFRRDKEVVLAAVGANGDALRHVLEEFKCDKEVVLAAVANNGSALEFASEELRGHEEVVLAAVAKDWLALRFASDELKRDKEVVLVAVANDWRALRYASDESKGDREVVLTAIENMVNPTVLRIRAALRMASDTLRADKDFMLSALSVHNIRGGPRRRVECIADGVVSNALRNDEEFVQLLSLDHSALQTSLCLTKAAQ